MRETFLQTKTPAKGILTEGSFQAVLT